VKISIACVTLAYIEYSKIDNKENQNSIFSIDLSKKMILILLNAFFIVISRTLKVAECSRCILYLSFVTLSMMIESYCIFHRERLELSLSCVETSLSFEVETHMIRNKK
jgi:L-asparagine transporter-like permease